MDFLKKMQNAKKRKRSPAEDSSSGSSSDSESIELDIDDEESVSEETVRAEQTTRSGRVSKPERRLQQDRVSEDEEVEQPPAKKRCTTAAKRKPKTDLREQNKTAGRSEKDDSYVIYLRPLSVVDGGIVGAVSMFISEYTDAAFGDEMRGLHVCEVKAGAERPQFDLGTKPTRTFRGNLLAFVGHGDGRSALQDYASPFCVIAMRVRPVANGTWLNEEDVSRYSVEPTYNLKTRIRDLHGLPLSQAQLRRYLVEKPVGKNMQVFCCAMAGGVPIKANALLHYEFVGAERVRQTCAAIGLTKNATLRPLITKTVPTNGRSTTAKGRRGEMHIAAKQMTVSPNDFNNTLRRLSTFLATGRKGDAELVKWIGERAESASSECLKWCASDAPEAKMARRFQMHTAQTTRAVRAATAELPRAPKEPLDLSGAAMRCVEWVDAAGNVTTEINRARNLSDACRAEARALLLPFMEAEFWAMMQYFGFENALRVLMGRRTNHLKDLIERNPLFAYLVPGVQPLYPEQIERELVLRATKLKSAETSVAAHDASIGATYDMSVARRMGESLRNSRWVRLANESQIEAFEALVNAEGSPVCVVETKDEARRLQWKDVAEEKAAIERMADTICSVPTIAEMVQAAVFWMAGRQKKRAEKFCVVCANDIVNRALEDARGVASKIAQLEIVATTPEKLIQLEPITLEKASDGTSVLLLGAESMPLKKVLKAVRQPDGDGKPKTNFTRVRVYGLAHAAPGSAFERVRSPQIPQTRNGLINLVTSDGASGRELIKMLGLKFEPSREKIEQLVKPASYGCVTIIYPSEGKITLAVNESHSVSIVAVGQNAPLHHTARPGHRVVVMLGHESNPMWRPHGAPMRKEERVLASRRLLAKLLRDRPLDITICGSPTGLFQEGVLGENFWTNDSFNE